MFKFSKQKIKKIKGIAIISVLIIVAIVAVFASKMTVNQQRFIKTSQAILSYQQQLLFVFSVEAWAEDLLLEDLKENNFDSFEDNWANELEDSQVGNSVLSGNLIDEQAKINLNILTNPKENEYIAQFNRLFDTLKLPKYLIDALIDYLDENNNRYSEQGAENNYYSRLQRPYKIANRAIVDLSELRLIKGFNKKVIARLTPWIWVGPKKIDKVNVNTAGEVVLRSLSDKIDTVLIQRILYKQRKTGFKNVNEFIAFIKPITVSKKIISTSSTYFLLESYIDNPQSGLKINTHLYRDSKKKEIKKLQRRIL